MLCYPQKFPKDKTKIAGIIVFRMPEKDVLLLEKPNGQLDLPKGHVEDGETFLEGALRECWEETGLDHHTNLDVYPYHYVSLPSKKWLRFYLGFTEEDDIRLTEHVDYHWVAIEEACQLFGHDNHFSQLIIAIDALSSN